MIICNTHNKDTSTLANNTHYIICYTIYNLRILFLRKNSICNVFKQCKNFSTVGIVCSWLQTSNTSLQRSLCGHCRGRQVFHRFYCDVTFTAFIWIYNFHHSQIFTVTFTWAKSAECNFFLSIFILKLNLQWNVGFSISIYPHISPFLTMKFWNLTLFSEIYKSIFSTSTLFYVALWAKRSALSLPFIPEWLGIHLKCMSTHISLIRWKISSSILGLQVDFPVFVADNAEKESLKIAIFCFYLYLS